MMQSVASATLQLTVPTAAKTSLAVELADFDSRTGPAEELTTTSAAPHALPTQHVEAPVHVNGDQHQSVVSPAAANIGKENCRYDTANLSVAELGCAAALSTPAPSRSRQRASDGEHAHSVDVSLSSNITPLVHEPTAAPSTLSPALVASKVLHFGLPDSELAEAQTAPADIAAPCAAGGAGPNDVQSQRFKQELRDTESPSRHPQPQQQRKLLSDPNEDGTLPPSAPATLKSKIQLPEHLLSWQKRQQQAEHQQRVAALPITLNTSAPSPQKQVDAGTSSLVDFVSSILKEEDTASATSGAPTVAERPATTPKQSCASAVLPGPPPALASSSAEGATPASAISSSPSLPVSSLICVGVDLDATGKARAPRQNQTTSAGPCVQAAPSSSPTSSSANAPSNADGQGSHRVASLLSLAGTLSPVPDEVFDLTESPASDGAQSNDNPTRITAAAKPSSPSIKRSQHPQPVVQANAPLRQKVVSTPPPPPIVVTVHWAQCDSCAKWRIVPHPLDDSASFCCSDAAGKTCQQPEDELPKGTVSGAAAISTAEAKGQGGGLLECLHGNVTPDDPAHKRQAGAPTTSSTRKKTEDGDGGLLSLLQAAMGPHQTAAGQDQTTVFEDLFVHKMQRMLDWKDKLLDAPASSATDTRVDQHFPRKFLDLFAAQVRASL